ncbi:hypothetical protein ASG52_16805 [Methylobacterium sp. Leaf456]|uniref:hypothetical protein n=1 Tax=Methylobacterium sp. Leaf456 TaxID=1736382 RepID=UPI0006F22B4D|nr:hypothetical protein [Methylobacterium sp. Leaf456]KQT60904.1 hypothetical protein ASG52_16805 [Methylobacterium sp. Leaf456]
MWTADRITIDIDEAEGSEMIVVIGTPSGVVRLAGAVRLSGGVLTIESAHVEGLVPGALGRGGLNASGSKILEVTGADSLVLQGSPRTTGRNPGRAPRLIRFPR